MNQEQLLARRDELAQENQLGELELHCTPWTFKGCVILAGVITGCYLAILVFLLAISGIHLSRVLPYFAPLLLIFLGVWSLSYLVSYLTNETYVYIYTNGLIYLNRSRNGVARWEEIGRVDLLKYGRQSALYVYLQDGTRIKFPTASLGSASYEALQKFIEGKIGLADADPVLPRQPLTSQSLPEPSLSSTSAIPQLKPSYNGSETSITGSVTLSIVQQSPDGHLTAKWTRDDFGIEYSCEGTITHEGTITLTSTDSHGDSALRIHGSLLPNGHLEGSLYAISKDGGSQRHSWSLA